VLPARSEQGFVKKFHPKGYDDARYPPAGGDRVNSSSSFYI
jgi:hypothetical protein